MNFLCLLGSTLRPLVLFNHVAKDLVPECSFTEFKIFQKVFFIIFSLVSFRATRRAILVEIHVIRGIFSILMNMKLLGASAGPNPKLAGQRALVFNK